MLSKGACYIYTKRKKAFSTTEINEKLRNAVYLYLEMEYIKKKSRKIFGKENFNKASNIQAPFEPSTWLLSL